MNAEPLCPYCLGSLQLTDRSCPHCGKDLSNRNPEGALAFGTQLEDGRYSIGDYVAADGEGLTYRAVDNTDGLFLTIKEYFPVTLSSGRTRDGSIRARSDREVLFKTTRMDFSDLYTTLRQITPAVGLVTVLDVFEANNTVYAVMENAKGVTLSRYMQLHKKLLNFREANELLAPVMQGLHFLHKNGLIHRGVSPENILLPIDGGARLTGYATLGLRSAGSELKAKLYGGYSAPEQYRASEFEGNYTDIYALAAVIYRLVSGKVPVPAGRRVEAAQDPLPPVRNLDPSIPAYYSKVLACAMRLDGSKRMQTVPELSAALNNPSEADAMLSKGKDKSGVSTMQLLGIFLVLVVLVVLAVIFIVMNLPQRQAGDAQSVASSVASSEEAAPSDGELTTVPNLVGAMYSEIRGNSTYQAYFRFAITDGQDKNAKMGAVLSQDPAAGTPLTGGSKITITLVVNQAPETVTMPNIIGFRQADAEKQLTDLEIRYSILTQTNYGEYLEGIVVNCDRSVGMEIDTENTVVNVYVAGPVQELPSEAEGGNEDGSADGGVLAEEGTPTENYEAGEGAVPENQ